MNSIATRFPPDLEVFPFGFSRMDFRRWIVTAITKGKTLNMTPRTIKRLYGDDRTFGSVAVSTTEGSADDTAWAIRRVISRTKVG